MTQTKPAGRAEERASIRGSILKALAVTDLTPPRRLLCAYIGTELVELITTAGSFYDYDCRDLSALLATGGPSHLGAQIRYLQIAGVLSDRQEYFVIDHETGLPRKRYRLMLGKTFANTDTAKSEVA